MQPQQNLRLCHIVVDHLCKIPVFKQNRDDNMIEAKHIQSCHISCSCHMRMVALQSLIYKHVLIFCVAML